jgi:hypothetical protein
MSEIRTQIDNEAIHTKSPTSERKLWSGEKYDGRLLGCPFCGLSPTILPWHGGPKTKRMVRCFNESCYVQPSVCGDTPLKAIKKWNCRPKPEDDS